MAREKSQLIVIDASIARAAGPEDAVHPTAKQCRDFLLAVLDICHRAVFSQEIVDEWRVHQSGFARQWRVSMFARKKIHRIDDPADTELRKHIGEVAIHEKQKEAILKDIHLIEAALRGGMRIAALDETVRNYLRSVSVSLGRLNRVCWINPDMAEEQPLRWLNEGAPCDDFRTLGFQPEDG